MMTISGWARIALIVCAVATIGGVVLGLRSCAAAPATQAAVAEIDAGLSAARAQSGADAVNDVGNVNERQASAEDISKENRDDIMAASGARAPVDRAVASAGLRSLCRRAAYRDSEQCRRLLGANPQ